MIRFLTIHRLKRQSLNQLFSFGFMCWLTVGLTQLSAAQPLSGADSIQGLRQQTDRLFAAWAKPGKPGFAVGVVHRGRLVYAKGFGSADVETGAPIDSQTVFQVASLSKQFTAYAIQLLVQAGKLSLDDNIKRYLPDVPDLGYPITIRHLLNHTSGLRDQWNLLALAGWQLDDNITNTHIMGLVTRQRGLNFPPGKEFLYCNTGYTLLAQIVARVTNQPFGAWMQQHVFNPLGMNRTRFYDDNQQVLTGRAYSFHQANDQEGAIKKSGLNYATVGATGLMTTVVDLSRWLTNFKHPVVGNQATVQALWQRGRLQNGDTLSYAAGLFHSWHRGHHYLGHSGADAGFRSYIGYFPRQEYGFIVLSNQAEANPGAKAMEVADLYLSPNELRLPKASSDSTKGRRINPTLFDTYVGDYQVQDRPNFILSLKRQGDRYFISATGQGEAELLASSDTTFSLTVADVQITVHRASSGKAPRLTLHQNGNHPALRIAAYQSSPDERRGYVGQYYSPELETIYSIQLTNDSLQLVHIHHGKTPLTVLKRDQLQSDWWFAPLLNVTRSPGGQIKGLFLTSGRVRNLWLERLPTGFGATKEPAANH